MVASLEIAENLTISRTVHHVNPLGKLPRRHTLTATVSSTHSCLLGITDVTKTFRYLVNAGAVVDVLPENPYD